MVGAGKMHNVVGFWGNTVVAYKKPHTNKLLGCIKTPFGSDIPVINSGSSTPVLLNTYILYACLKIRLLILFFLLNKR